MGRKKSPYLKDDCRLADVISAIQVLATYKFYKLEFTQWADRIAGDVTKADHWKCVFEEHPEFFRLDAARERASLVWRRQHQKLFSVDKEDKITKEEFKGLSDAEKQRISRTPLNSQEIATLIDTAINLHSRALEHRRDNRWLLTGLIGLGGVLIGALITAASNFAFKG